MRDIQENSAGFVTTISKAGERTERLEIRNQTAQLYAALQIGKTKTQIVQLLGGVEVPLIFSEYFSGEVEFRIGSGRYDHNSKSETEKLPEVTNDFARIVDTGGFDDPALLEIIQQFHQTGNSGIRESLKGANAFYYQERLENENSYDDRDNLTKKMDEARRKLGFFLEYLDILEGTLKKVGGILGAHPLFADLEKTLQNMAATKDILLNLRIQALPPTIEKDGRSRSEYDFHESSIKRNVFSVNVNQAVTNNHQIPNKTHTSDSMNVFEVYREYVHSSKLNKAIPDIIGLGVFIDYCEQIRDVDAKHEGVLPCIEKSDGRGLHFSFTGMHNAALAWKGKKDSYGYERRDLPKSVAFGDIALGMPSEAEKDAETIIVLPGPNMAGKTTFMKGVGYCLHLGRMGRKVPCTEASMTLPDEIFHNFSVKDNVHEQISTFKAQLTNTRNFLAGATVNSLGLFDELFNGTSADYQLALAWAFLERCSENKLRTIVSTHNRHLEYFSDPDGFERIRGVFAQGNEPIQSHGAHGSKTLSIDANHNVQVGSQRDSKAMEIAKEVFEKDLAFIERAEEILRHLRMQK